jgi:hypothetical protein
MIFQNLKLSIIEIILRSNIISFNNYIILFYINTVNNIIIK